VRLRKPIDSGGDTLDHRLAGFRFNSYGCPEHRSKVAGELRVESMALDAR
jgi:hypothetical protein